MIAYKVDFKNENDVDLLDSAMALYSLTVLKKQMSRIDQIILQSYLLNGYSPNTKKLVCMELSMKPGTLNARNWTLQKKGFLIPHPKNQKLKLVSPELVALKDAFINGEKRKMFIVNFVQ